jgi:hypothetical protein
MVVAGVFAVISSTTVMARRIGQPAGIFGPWHSPPSPEHCNWEVVGVVLSPFSAWLVQHLTLHGSQCLYLSQVHLYCLILKDCRNDHRCIQTWVWWCKWMVTCISGMSWGHSLMTPQSAPWIWTWTSSMLLMLLWKQGMIQNWSEWLPSHSMAYWHWQFSCSDSQDHNSFSSILDW